MKHLRALLALASLSAIATAQTTVVPPIFSTTEANSLTSYPWNTAGIRIQYIYDDTTFTSQSINFPILINQVRWRPNGGVTCVGRTYSNVTVSMSTAAVDHLVVTNNFASNHGTDLATVYTGPVTVDPITVAATPNPFYVTINLATPFLYDPTQGDLNVDVAHDGVFTGGTSASVDMTTTTGAPWLGSRVWALSPTATTAASVQPNLIAPMEVSYTPAAGLYASFTANVTSGPVPLTVNFTDTSFSSDPNGITSWTWDLNGDGIADSNLQNPTFLYGACGAYNVSLTVTDATHPANTFTRTGYIQVGIAPIAPSFTFSPIAPGVYQFTDTSVPTPASWDWDLNGDGITDSTAQNPIWAYPAPCTSVNVRLSVTNTCAGPWSTTRPLALSPAVATAVPFTGGNGTTSTTVVGNMFDLQVTNPNGITVCSLTQGIYSYVGPFNADVYVTDGSYLGKEANAAAWRLVASGSGVANGGPTTPATPYPVALNNNFYLPAGNYGMVVYLSRPGGGTMNVAYTNGPQGPFVGPDVTFFPNPTTAPGRASTGLFTTGGIVSRVWNGALNYSTRSNGDLAGYGFFGPGCAGSLGVSRLTPSAMPAVGTTLNVGINNLPLSAGIMLTGFSNTVSAFGPLPVDAASFGAPGCSLRSSTEISSFVLGVGNTATWSLTIPSGTGLIGLLLFNQAAVIDPGFNPAGVVLSDAAGFMVGL